MSRTGTVGAPTQIKDTRIADDVKVGVEFDPRQKNPSKYENKNGYPEKTNLKTKSTPSTPRVSPNADRALLANLVPETKPATIPVAPSVETLPQSSTLGGSLKSVTPPLNTQVLGEQNKPITPAEALPKPESTITPFVSVHGDDGPNKIQSTSIGVKYSTKNTSSVQTDIKITNEQQTAVNAGKTVSTSIQQLDGSVTIPTDKNGSFNKIYGQIKVGTASNGISTTRERILVEGKRVMPLNSKKSAVPVELSTTVGGRLQALQTTGAPSTVAARLHAYVNLDATIKIGDKTTVKLGPQSRTFFTVGNGGAPAFQTQLGGKVALNHNFNKQISAVISGEGGVNISNSSAPALYGVLAASINHKFSDNTSVFIGGYGMNGSNNTNGNGGTGGLTDYSDTTIVTNKNAGFSDYGVSGGVAIKF